MLFLTTCNLSPTPLLHDHICFPESKNQLTPLPPLLCFPHTQHVKPILSALIKSPHSLAPTTSPENPLELHIPLPPPTRDSHSAIADTVTRHGEAAGLAISNARLAHKKKLRRLELSHSVRPDVFYKSGIEMEKVVATGTAELKRLMDGAWKKT